MKLIGFIGAFDKIDMILNIAKVLASSRNKVLIVDSTVLQKARYIVPAINPVKSYITTFEEVDVAVGFEKLEDIKRYLALSNTESFDYEIVLIDCDNAESFKSFNLHESEINYFVTSYGPYSLKKGLEILQEVDIRVPIKKVLFSRYMSEEDDEYLSFLSKNMNIDWLQEKIFFPLEEGDLNVNLENQHSEKINFKPLSESYKEGVAHICAEILKDKTNISEIKRTIKALERG